MLKRILLLLCFSGIAVYSVKIYQLKDKVSFVSNSTNSATSSNGSNGQIQETLRLQFYMESDQADLLKNCYELFNSAQDKILLNTLADNPKIANLSVERDFKANEMQSILELQKRLQSTACLQSPKSRFSFAPIGTIKH